MTKKFLILLFTFIILSGCSGVSKFSETLQAVGEAMQGKESAQNICLQAGFKESTPEYAKCFLEIKKAQIMSPKSPIYNNRNSSSDSSSSGFQHIKPTTFCDSSINGRNVSTTCY